MPRHFLFKQNIVSSTALDRFWIQTPALLYGLAMLLGVAFGLDFRWEWIIPGAFLFAPLISGKSRLVPRLGLAFLIALASGFYVSAYYRLPDLPPDGVKGEGYFEIHGLIKSNTHIGSRWVYKGTLKSFYYDGKIIGKNIPLQISLSEQSYLERPLANRSYAIEGILRKNEAGYYSLTPIKDQPWKALDRSWSLAEWRYLAKKIVKEYIKDHISNSQSAIFLGGLATGEFEDRLMKHEFGRFGLQHIMAISGFHFAIIALILSVLFRLILQKKSSHLLLMLLLSTYFVFLGTSASILRAWIAIVLALGATLIQKRGNGLNSLGVGLMVLLLIDPLMVQGIGFQFSFAVTAAILMIYGSCDRFIEMIVEKRGLFQTKLMNSWNQHGYLVIQGLRQGLALALAVNLAALPLLLFHFHKFPMMSLVYNLFFPFLVSLSMLLLLLGLFCPFLHYLNSFYTGAVLNLTYRMPQTVDAYWRIDGIPLWAILGYLSLLFYAFIYAKDHLSEKNELAFI